MSNIWIARDKGGSLYVYDKKPLKSGNFFFPISKFDLRIPIPSRMYPEVTWENSPRELVVKEE